MRALPFDEAFLRDLEALRRRLLRRKDDGDRGAGGRRRGGTLEYAESREYMPGDEFRYIDWNLYGRSGRLYVKQFAREESRQASILLDRSASLGPAFPAKHRRLAQLAGALSYLALAGGGSCGCTCCRPSPRPRLGGGRQAWREAWRRSPPPVGRGRRTWRVAWAPSSGGCRPEGRSSSFPTFGMTADLGKPWPA